MKLDITSGGILTLSGTPDKTNEFLIRSGIEVIKITRPVNEEGNVDYNFWQSENPVKDGYYIYVNTDLESIEDEMDSVLDTDSDADYYGVLFLCVIPNQLYFKFIKKEDIPFASLHDRRSAGTGSGYKWDHKLTDVYPIDTIDEFREKFESTFSEVFR